MKKLFLLPLLLLAGFVHAAEYIAGGQVGYSSPEQAATDYMRRIYPDNAYVKRTMAGCDAGAVWVQDVNGRKVDMRFVCKMVNTNLQAGGSSESVLYVFRLAGNNKCSSEEGKTFSQLVPLGSVKITDLDKGTYDFQPRDPPKFVCKSGCLVKLEGAGKYWGDAFIDYMNPDENGAYTFASRVEYLGTGKQCTPNDASEGLKEPAEKTDEEKEPDEDKCKAEGGSYGEINGKKVCLGIDNKDKCLSGQTPGYINGKLVCLTPEGEKLPEKEETNPGGGDGKDGNGIGGGDQTDGKGTGIDGTGTGDGKGGSGGGSGGGKGTGDGEGEGEGECKDSDRLGCMKAGTPKKEGDFDKSEKNVGGYKVTPVSLPTACPSARQFNVSGFKWKMEMSPLCQAADVARPFVLLMASFFSMMIVMGGLKKK